MGQILTVAYKLFNDYLNPAPLPLSQKIKNQLNFLSLHCTSDQLKDSLLEMRLSDGFRKSQLQLFYEDLARPDKRKDMIPNSLEGNSKFIINDIKSSLNHIARLVENLTTYRQDLDDQVTDELIETLKLDLNQLSEQMAAQAYMCIIIATESLGTKNPDWKEELKDVLNCETCADDLKDDYQTYQNTMSKFREDNNNSPEFVEAMNAWLAELEALLPSLKLSAGKPGLKS
jgi:hypothetical protein